MGWRSLEKLIPWAIAVVLAGVLYDGYHLAQASYLNRALASVAAGAAPGIDHPRLSFARAFALQQAGKFEAAVKAYAAIDVPDDAPLHRDVQYNLANLYLRRALEFRDQGARDLALPLIELAKENYRELLRVDSRNWSAKYNLELALRLVPDVDPEAAEEERDPEHNPRAAAGIRVRRPLP